MVGTTTMSPTATPSAIREVPIMVGTAAVMNRGATVAEIVAEEEALLMVVVVVIVVLCSVITATKLATRHVIVQIVPPVVAGKTDRSAALVR